MVKNNFKEYVDFLSRDEMFFSKNNIEDTVNELLEFPRLDSDVYYKEMFSVINNNINHINNKIIMNNLGTTLEYLNEYIDSSHIELSNIDNQVENILMRLDMCIDSNDGSPNPHCKKLESDIDQWKVYKWDVKLKLQNISILKNNIVLIYNAFIFANMNQESLKESNNIKFELEELDKTLKSQQTDFIGLLALFSSLAFIVFGGLGYLNSLGQIIDKLSNERLIFVSILFSFITFNLISLFLYMVEKIIDPNPSKLDKVILIVNGVLIITLLCSLK